MGPKAESAITSEKSRANNLIVFNSRFGIKFTSSNGFKLFLDVLLNFAPLKDHRDWIVT